MPLTILLGFLRTFHLIFENLNSLNLNELNSHFHLFTYKSKISGSYLKCCFSVWEQMSSKLI